MPWSQNPTVDFDDHRQFIWEHWRVGFELDDIFGVLHDQFNTVPFFIQDQVAFHQDVADVAEQSNGQQEFLKKLKMRRDDRLQELITFKRINTSLLLRGYGSLDAEQFTALRNLCYTASFDSLVSFLGSLVGPNEDGSEPPLG